MNGMSDQSIGNTFHMPPYIRGSSYNGAISKDEENDTAAMQSDAMLNEFKNALRIISSDVSANAKQHRNGDNGEFWPHPFSEPMYVCESRMFKQFQVRFQILVSLVLGTIISTRQQII